MDPALEGLQPESLWRHVETLARLSRGSPGDPALADHLLAAAKALRAEAQLDRAGNLLIRKPPSPGREKARSLCVHCPVDAPRAARGQASERESSAGSASLSRNADFLGLSDPFRSPRELAALAVVLSLLEEGGIEHGPLELLVTFAGQDGASSLGGLDPGSLRSRAILDLSFDEEGALCVGCAGFVETSAVWRIEREEPRRGSVGAEIRVSGLRGGDASRDIDKCRGNAIKILARALARLQELGGRVSAVSAPGAWNEIPREATALLVFPRSLPRRAEPALKKLAEGLREELGPAESAPSLRLVPSEEALKPIFRRHLQKKILRATMALPFGALRASPREPRRVEASANVVSISTEEDALCLRTIQRSSVSSLLSDLAESVQGIFLLSGAKLRPGLERPAWRADPRSRLLRAARAASEAVYGKRTEEKTTHRTLECAVLSERFRGFEMVSIGPAVSEAGSPRETIDVRSVERLWRTILEILKRVE